MATKSDPMYSCHVHLLGSHFLSLRASTSPLSSSSSSSSSSSIPSSSTGCTLFSRNGRPVYRVQISGIVVCVERKEKFLSFLLDDGTACVPCILWLNFFNHFRSNPLPTSYQAEVKAELAFEDAAKVKLGSLLRVQGRTSSFQAQIQVTVSSIHSEANPNAETFLWLDCMRLALHHYDLPPRRRNPV